MFLLHFKHVLILVLGDTWIC